MEDLEDLGLPAASAAGGGTAADAAAVVSTLGDGPGGGHKQYVLPQRPTRSLRRAPEPSAAQRRAVPGTQRLWLRTFGCSHNISDSEYMEGILRGYGYKFVTDDETDEDWGGRGLAEAAAARAGVEAKGQGEGKVEEKEAVMDDGDNHHQEALSSGRRLPAKERADLWLVNSCTVKNPSEVVFLNLVAAAKAEGKPLVVAGCVPQANRKLKGLEGVSVVGVQQIDRVLEVVEETLRGNTVRLFGRSSLPRLDLPKVRRNELVEIIPLSTGCLNACTYCSTHFARGKLGSYDPDAIVSRVQRVIQEGVTQIWLSSEDTGAYGRDINTSLSALVRRIVDVLPEHVMLRIGMTNPPYILEQLDDMVELMRHPNVFSFLHVPVQAASNRVLEVMKREYTVEEFMRVCDHLLNNVPGMRLVTDVICGFPSETEEEFDETMALMAHYRFCSFNISQFYPRPGTVAAKMQLLPTKVVKGRSRRLSELHRSFTPFHGWEGRVEKVWVDTEISEDGGHTVGHTKAFDKVLLPLDPNLKGCCVEARITSTARYHVVAEVLRVLIDYREALAKLGGVVELSNTAAASTSGACCGRGSGSNDDCGCSSGTVEEKNASASKENELCECGKPIGESCGGTSSSSSSSSSPSAAPATKTTTTTTTTATTETKAESHAAQRSASANTATSTTNSTKSAGSGKGKKRMAMADRMEYLLYSCAGGLLALFLSLLLARMLGDPVV